MNIKGEFINLDSIRKQRHFKKQKTNKSKDQGSEKLKVEKLRHTLAKSRKEKGIPQI